MLVKVAVFKKRLLQVTSDIVYDKKSRDRFSQNMLANTDEFLNTGQWISQYIKKKQTVKTDFLSHKKKYFMHMKIEFTDPANTFLKTQKGFLSFCKLSYLIPKK